MLALAWVLAGAFAGGFADVFDGLATGLAAGFTGRFEGVAIVCSYKADFVCFWCTKLTQLSGNAGLAAWQCGEC